MMLHMLHKIFCKATIRVHIICQSIFSISK